MLPPPPPGQSYVAVAFSVGRAGARFNVPRTPAPFTLRAFGAKPVGLVAGPSGKRGTTQLYL